MTESVKPFSKLYDLTQRAEKVGISDDDVLREIRIEKIVPNKYQPRREFTEDKIKELAESIKQNGLLQSITVRDMVNSGRTSFTFSKVFRVSNNKSYC